MPKGQIFVISGPSGVGKDTVVGEVLKDLPEAFLSVSFTTRAPRGSEQNGVEYFFITREEFEREIKCGNVLEYCDYLSVVYGTPKPPIDKALEEGRPVLLVIERDGMEQVKKIYPDAVTVFIAPPSVEVLRKRLIGRNTETPEAVEKRLAKAMIELEGQSAYMHTVVNGELEVAVDEVKELIKHYMR